MNDRELRDAAVLELKQTTRGLKGYSAPASSHWGKALDLLSQITLFTIQRDAAISELRLTTVGYSKYLQQGIEPPLSSHWGKALTSLKEIDMKVTLSFSPSTTPLAGTVTVTATCNPPKVTRVEFYIDNVLKSPVDTSAPFTYLWDTSAYADGPHNVSVKAFYPTNQMEPAQVTKQVKNLINDPPPDPPPGKPVLITAPVISDVVDPDEGEVLFISNGTWTNNPTSYTRQWDRCDAAGANCVDIPSATGTSYLLTAADVGSTIRCWTTAFNVAGPSAAYLSAQTAVVGGTAAGIPVNQTPPVITGTPTEGQFLTVNAGAWTNSPNEIKHFWARCTDTTTGSCSVIAGEGDFDFVPVSEHTTYQLTSTDVGKRIRCYTTVRNATGESAFILTAPTAVVAQGSGGGGTPPGTLINTYAQIVNNQWGQIWENKCDNQNGGQNVFLNQGDPCPVPWSGANAGGGIFALTDAQTGGRGGGWKFIVHPGMVQEAGGKLAFLCDIDHWTAVNQTEDWSGNVMFPAAGNTSGFTTGPGRWNTFWEWHTAIGAGGFRPQMGIEQPNNQFYFESYNANDPSNPRGNFWQSSNGMVYGQWYLWRIWVRWSSGSDGFYRTYLNGLQGINYSGPTMPVGERPYLQFGFYSTAQYSNEVWHAGIRRA